jgi:hypothetical protein
MQVFDTEKICLKKLKIVILKIRFELRIVDSKFERQFIELT